MNTVPCAHCSREVIREYVRGNGRSCVLCEGDRNRQDHDRLFNLIRELKGNPGEDRKKEVIRDITALGHPDVAGLLKAIEDKASAPAPRKQRHA